MTTNATISFRPVADADYEYLYRLKYERLGFVVVGETDTHYQMRADPPKTSAIRCDPLTRYTGNDVDQTGSDFD